jgi:GMP synthase (glutamine-hydrolysing)
MPSPDYAFRVGDCAWGVQFHPEFNVEIVRGYLRAAGDELAAQGQSLDELLAASTEAPESARVLSRFAEIVEPGRASAISIPCVESGSGSPYRPGPWRE